MPTSLEQLHEEFIKKKLKKMERDLVNSVDSPYKETSDTIVKKVEEIFKKYEHVPEVLRYTMIKQEFERQKVFRQIEERYDLIGRSYVRFLKGSLKENFEEAVKHSELILNDLKTNSDKFQLHYEETNDIESDWRRRTKKHSQKVNTILTQGIAKHEAVDQITEKLIKEGGMQVYEAKRLARTEVSRVLNEASFKVYREVGVKKVRWLDSTEQVKLINRKRKSKTVVCDHCRSYATGGEKGKGIYPLGNLPSPIPAHPNCRCTIAPVID
jgi:hypothetical protein